MLHAFLLAMITQFGSPTELQAPGAGLAAPATHDVSAAPMASRPADEEDHEDDDAQDLLDWIRFVLDIYNGF